MKVLLLIQDLLVVLLIKMVSSLQRFGIWLFGLKGRDVTRYPLDEELIKRDKIISAQQQQLMARDSQLAIVSAKENEKVQKEKDGDYGQEIIKKLNTQKEEIREKRFKHTFSWRFFLNKCGYESKPTKFGKSIDLTDKDDKVIFGKFGDFISTDNGYIVIKDSEGNIITLGKELSQVIWKPDALVNYMKRARIPLAVDENLRPVQDLEEQEYPDVVYDSENNEYAETEGLQKPVRELLIERDERHRDLLTKFERVEQTNIDKGHTIDTLNRSIRMLENRTGKSQSELSGVLSKAMEFENKVSTIQNKLIKSTETNAIQEMINEKQKSIITSILSQLEKYGDKTLYKNVKAEVKDDIEFYSGILPEKQPAEKESPTQIQPKAQPGERIG